MMMKKIFLFKIILLFLFIFVVFNTNCFATNSDFTYEIDGNKAIITSYTGSNITITIPSSIDGYEVEKIANHAFNANKNSHNQILKKVTISEGITTIGDFAFIGCTNLESIELPESLTSLGDQTFIGCTKLKQINIPSKITSFGYSGSMFQETGFTEFVIPENVKNIPGQTFRICQNLKKVTVYSDDVVYGSGAFEYCSNDLILYGNEGSTTQTYAEQNNLQFRVLSNENTNIPVESITLNKSTLSLYVGDTETLIATVLPDNATDKKLIWSSSNPDVASVNDGIVTAKSIGSTTITVSSNDGIKKANCSITITEKENTEPTIIPVTSITLNKSSLSLYVGDAETLIATVLPDNATDKKLIWSSSNSNIVTVENGKVIAKNVGSATITVSNSDNSIKNTCTVSVSNKVIDSEPTKDDSTVNGSLPQAGLKFSLLGILVTLLFIITLVSYKKYINFKNI